MEHGKKYSVAVIISIIIISLLIGLGFTADSPNLTIWDTTNSETKYKNQQINFYANYSNITSGAPINGTGVYCNISFNITPGGPFNMIFNSTSLLYEYNRSFTSSGNYTWNVSCNGLAMGYEELNSSDSVIVNGTGTLNSILYGPANNTPVSQYSIFTINTTVTCTGDSGADCGVVYALARYNTSTLPDTTISTLTNASPFYIMNYSGGDLNPEPLLDWNRTFAAGRVVYSTAIDSLDNIIITGFSDGSDYITVKYNSSGSHIWNDTFSDGNSAHAVTTDSHDNIIVTGDSGSGDYVTVKYNSTGSHLWNTTFIQGNVAYGVAVDSQDNIIVTGNNDSNKWLTVKYNSSGSQLWNTTFTDGFLAYGVAVDSQDNIIVTGYDSSNYLTVKYNSSGSQLWNTTFADGIIAYGVAVDRQDNIIITGYDSNNYFLTVKYNSSGIHLWNTTFSDGYRAQDIAIDSRDNIIVVGSNKTGTSYDWLAVKYNSTGGILWNKTFNEGREAQAVDVDSDDNIIVAGWDEFTDYFTVKYLQGVNPRRCPNMIAGENCTVTWTINTTGATDTSYYIDVFFYSSIENLVPDNDTIDAKICIGTCSDSNLTFLVNETNTISYSYMNGTLTNITFNETLSALQLGPGLNYGAFTSQIFNVGFSATWNNISWISNVIGELPDNQGVETNPDGANMTGNLFLFHLNNDSAYGENSTHFFDYSGYGNNGSCNGTTCPTFNSSGKLGAGAFDFDGIDDYINIPRDSSLEPTTAITVSAWFYWRNHSNSDWGVILDKSTESSNPWTSYSLIQNNLNASDNQRIHFSINIDNTFYRTDAVYITENEWHHLAGTWNSSGQTLRLYVDGVEQGNNLGASGNIVYNNTPLQIGQNTYTNPNDAIDGLIDEVAIWNRSLSVDEILDIYKRGIMKLNLSVRSCNDSNCTEENFVDINDVSPQNLSIPNNIFFQYKFSFETENTSYSPELYNVTINYINVPPEISFTPPTPDNGTSTSNTSIRINVSINESDLGEVRFNWNGTNYTIYNDSLVSMLNFNNVSVLGENDTFMFDASRYENNGYCSGSNCPASTTSGKYSSAFNFNNSGVRDEITIYDSPTLKFNSTLTITAWVMNKDINVNYNGLFDKKGNVWSRHTGFHIELAQTGATTNAGKVYVVGDNASYGTLPCVSNWQTTDLNKWVFMAIVYNNTQATLYCNGNSGSTGNIYSVIPSNYDITIGYRWNGTIDEVTLWNRSLSSSEIQQLYFTNLYKYDTDRWILYVNQSKNSTEGLDDGDYTYQAFASDSTGNWNMTEARIININTSIPPEITIDSPQNTTYNTGDIDYNITVSEALDTAYISIDNGPNMSMNNDTATHYFNLSGSHPTLSDGMHNATFWVNDTEGNTSSSTTYFIVDTTPPIIDFINITPPNQTNTNNDSVQINISITETNLDEVIYNWNGTNYTIYNDSLVLFFNFNNVSSLGENDTYIVDASKYGNDGYCTGSTCPLFNSEGKYGGGFEFDGTDDFINTTKSSSLNMTFNFTVSAWVKNKNPNIYYDRIITKKSIWDDTNGWDIHLVDDTGSIQIYGSGTIGNDIPCVSDWNTTDRNRWVHVVVVYHTTTATLYCDGTEKGTSNIDPIVTNNITVRIGRMIQGAAWNGTIDEVMIWNRSLSSSEIQQLYFMNLRKFNSTQWYLYVNQSKNSSVGLDEGTYTYQAFALDDAGNFNQTNQRTLTVDTTPPTIASLADDGPIEVYNFVNVSANVTDNVAVDKVVIEIEEPDNTRTNYTTSLVQTDIYYNDTINTSQLGVHTYRIYANDTSNNLNDTESSTFTVWDNTTPPAITIDSPQNTTYNTGNIDYNITASEALDTAYISIDNGPNMSMNNDTATHYFNLSGSHPTLSDGIHNATFWVNDTTGNINTSTVWFIVDKQHHDYTYRSCYGGTNENQLCSNDSNCPGGTCLDAVVAWWNLDEASGTRMATGGTCADAGSDCDLTDYNTTGQDTTNKKEGSAAASFNASNDEYLSCTDATCDELDIVGDITGGCWVQPSTLNQNMVFMYKYDMNNGYSFVIGGGTSNFGCYIWDGTGAAHQDGAYGSVPDDAFTHIICRFDDTTNEIVPFANGQVNGCTPGVDCITQETMTSSAGDFSLSKNYTTQDFDGQLDECFVADQAYTSYQICEICRFGLDGEAADRGATCGNCDYSPPPAITIDSPQNTTYNTGDIDYNITVSEALDTALVSIDGGANMTMDNDTSTHYFNLSGNHSILLSGSHNATFFVNNSIGSSNQSTVYFTVAIPPPIINNYYISPQVVVNGSETRLFINASNINAVWASIILPNATEQNITLTNNENTTYVNTILTGSYNVTFFANNTDGNTTNATSHFIAQEGMLPNITVITYNQTGINSSIEISYENSTIYSNTSTTGNYSLTLPSYLFDMQFRAYSDRLRIILRNVNITDNNQTFGMDKPTVSGYLATYGIENNYNFTNATVTIYYDDTSFTNENLLKLHRCSNWNFTNRNCGSTWQDITSQITHNKTGDYFQLETTTFSAFSIQQGSSSSSQPDVTSGGGGDGGGGMLPSKTKDFTLNTLLIKNELKQKETSQETFIITNNGSRTLNLTLELSNFHDIITISENKFILNSSQSKRVALYISIPDNYKPGVYTGKLTIKDGGLEKSIDIVIEVKEIQALFDVTVGMQEIFKNVLPGEEIIIDVTAFNLGILGRVDIILEYILKDFEGESILIDHETAAVETKMSATKKIKIPETLKPGRYVIEVRLKYNNNTATSSITFNVVEDIIIKSREKEAGYPYVLTIASAIVAAGIILELLVFYYYRKKSSKIHYQRRIRRAIQKYKQELAKE